MGWVGQAGDWCVSVCPAHVGVDVGGRRAAIDQALGRLAARAAKQLDGLSGGAARRRESARVPRRWCRWPGGRGRRRGTPLRVFRDTKTCPLSGASSSTPSTIAQSPSNPFRRSVARRHAHLRGRTQREHAPPPPKAPCNALSNASDAAPAPSSTRTPVGQLITTAGTCPPTNAAPASISTSTSGPLSSPRALRRQ